MSAPLPSTRPFISNLISALPSAAPGSASNLLSVASSNERNILLTLHILFPNELLPALDLLDRGLVTRFRIYNGNDKDNEKEIEEEPRIEQDEGTSIHETTIEKEATESERDSVGRGINSTSNEGEHASTAPVIYYVRSAQQQRSSRFASTSNDSSSSSYEVRLDAWNCSCPAFAFAAFPSTLPRPVSPTSLVPEKHAVAHDGQHGAGEEEAMWEFGGLCRGDAIICKHLLACVLVEKSEMFRGLVEDKVVSVEEAAGWAAGWGA